MERALAFFLFAKLGRATPCGDGGVQGVEFRGVACRVWGPWIMDLRCGGGSGVGVRVYKLPGVCYKSVKVGARKSAGSPNR